MGMQVSQITVAKALPIERSQRHDEESFIVEEMNI
jgi:hypothetical protein